MAKPPSGTRGFVETCKALNPGLRYHYYTDEDLRNEVAAHEPGLLLGFDQMAGVEKADMGRYFLLYVHGGVYLDTDVECLRPLDDLLGLETPAAAGVHVLLSPAGNEFWRGLITYVLDNYVAGRDPVVNTGSGALMAYLEIIPVGSVKVLDRCAFPEEADRESCLITCTRMQTFGIHHSLHSWESPSPRKVCKTCSGPTLKEALSLTLFFALLTLCLAPALLALWTRPWSIPAGGPGSGLPPLARHARPSSGPPASSSSSSAPS